MPEIPATLPPEQKRSILATLLRPKVAIPVSLVVLLLLSPLIIRGWFLRGVPDIPEPFDAEPILALEIPDAENAYVDYRLASSLYIAPSQHVAELRDGETFDVPLGINKEGWHLADDDVRQFLHDNENALLTWKRGSEKDNAQYLPARDYDIATILDVPQSLREFQRAVMLLGRKLEAEGQHVHAWEWYRAAMRASRHSGRNGILIERLIGIACFSLTAQRLEDWAAQPGVSRELLLRAVNELEADWKLTEKNSTVWKIDYLSTMTTIAQCESGKLNWSDLEVSASWDVPINSSTLFLMGEPTLGKRLLRIFFDNQLQYCDLPPFERPDDFWSETGLFQTGNPEELTPEEFDLAVQRSFIANLFLFGSQHVHQAFDRDEIKYRTLLVTLAGQAFYRDHQRFPMSLAELVPDYLDEIPLDIYDGKPLKYRFDADGPVVYSVFENGTDEGGLEWSFDQILGSGKIGPDDLGFRMHIPRIKPLRAEKPADLIEEEGYLEYGSSDVEVP